MATAAGWQVRDARAGDLPAIAECNRLLALETEGKALDAGILAAGVGRLLSDPTLGRYFVAESPGGIIGQAMVTREWSDWRNGLFWWLQSVYVHEGHRGQGVFRSLCRHVEALARADAGVCGLRLYMEQNNAPARSAYAALGFQEGSYRIFEKQWVRVRAG